MFNSIITFLIGHEAALQILYYLDSKGLYGAVIPFVISVAILIYYKSYRFTKLELALFGVCIAVPMIFHHWNYAGLTIFPISIFIWPLYTLFTKKHIPILLIYPLVFFGVLIPDVSLNYLQHVLFLHRLPWYWWTITGGAGFQDGLFLTPLTTILICLIGYLYFHIYKNNQRVLLNN